MQRLHGRQLMTCVMPLALLFGCASSQQAPPSLPSAPPPPNSGSGSGASSSAGSGSSASSAATGEESPQGQPGSAGGALPGSARTPQERGEALDRDLNESLSKFDATLAREQEVLAAKREAEGAAAAATAEAEKEAATAETAADGAGKPGVSRTDPGRTGASRAEREGAGGAGKPGERADAGEKGENAERGGARGGGSSSGTPRPSAGGAEGGGPSTPPEGAPVVVPAGVPPDVGDGRDDDVVARQLREAAMSEKDPALRDKLWQEYRDYKKSGGGE
ncbi:MAG: hypothetical protein NDJ94_04775 [Vicinamibacteria bacterium]|nr:hypothetical protein [Vicinamibacteria bacterium]